MNESLLQLIVRTPHRVVVETFVRSLRVPTATGQVGLRPRCEPLVLAIEARLILAYTHDGLRFVGTAGGLLTCDGKTATITSPVAVIGESQEQLQQELNRILGEPTEDMQARTALQRLEAGILNEIRSERRDRSWRGGAPA